MSKTTQEERNEMRRVIDNDDGRPVVTLFRTEAREAVNDADRLDAIEQEVESLAEIFELEWFRSGKMDRVFKSISDKLHAILDPPERS